jgi:hypothetical protein
MAAPVTATTGQVPKREPTSVPRAEIARLIDDLRSDHEKVRQIAEDRLVQIGHGAMSELATRKVFDRPEHRQRALEVISRIQAKHGIAPVRVNGLEFVASVSDIWRIPAPGKSNNIRLIIKITNYRDEAVFFYRLNAIHFALVGANGKVVQGGIAGDHVSISGQSSVRLAKGESYEINNFFAKLHRRDDRPELSFVGNDGSGGTFYFGGLRQGRYYVLLRCKDFEVIGPSVLKDGTPRWRGDAVLSPVEVEIID